MTITEVLIGMVLLVMACGIAAAWLDMNDAVSVEDELQRMRTRMTEAVSNAEAA